MIITIRTNKKEEENVSVRGLARGNRNHPILSNKGIKRREWLDWIALLLP